MIFPMSVCGVPIRAIHVTPDDGSAACLLAAPFFLCMYFLFLCTKLVLLIPRMCFVQPSDPADPPARDLTDGEHS